VQDGDVLHLGDLEVTVLDTPGHTDDSVSYLVGDRVFTGDSLTIRGAGRTDFQNGDARTLYRSIVSTIGEERRLNPRIAGKTVDEFVAIMNGLGLPRPKRIDEAVPANRGCGAVRAS
jgi:sulfur dioxygenase